MMKKKKLSGKKSAIKIVFQHPYSPNFSLEKDLGRRLRKSGFIWCASGYNVITGERDICFERKK